MMMVSEWILIVTIVVPGVGNWTRPEIVQIPVQSRVVCEKVAKLVVENAIRDGLPRVSYTCVKVVE